MVIVAFQVVNKLGRYRVFQETLLLADISKKVVLGMTFLTFSNADIQFTEEELTWRTYTTKKALPTTRQVEIVNWKEFAKAALDENVEALVVYVSFLRLKMSIYPVRKAQLVLLVIKEANVPIKYMDFADIFSEKSANIPPKQTGANEHAIKLEEGEQPLYGPIYSLGPIELETLKIYIETNLATGFIQALKSPAGAPILFLHKPDDNLRLCVNY